MQRRNGVGLLMLLLAWALVIPQLADASPASPGDFLVIDFDAGTGGRGALFTVDPSTGSRTIVSDFGNPIQGPLGVDPFGVALDASGTILVVDPFAGTGGRGALFTVDPSTGSRTILSDFGNPIQGPLGTYTIGLALDASGTILVVAAIAGTGNLGALFTVDPATGTRTILSDFGDVNQGPTGSDPFGVALDASGTILVVDYNAGPGGLGALFTVDPATGARTILSDFGNGTQGPTGVGPISLALEASGTILVADDSAGTGGLGALFTVNPATGARTILSNFGDVTQGATGVDPTALTLDASGTILLMDNQAGTGFAGALFTVDPASGDRAIISDFGNPIEGPIGVHPSGIVIFTAVTTPPDTVPPDTAITGAVDGKNKPIADGAKTSSTSIRFTFTGSDDVGVGGFECSLDGAAFSACSSPTSYTTLGGGAHTFQVRAVDTSGSKDPAPALFSWFVSGNKFK